MQLPQGLLLLSHSEQISKRPQAFGCGEATSRQKLTGKFLILSMFSSLCITGGETGLSPQHGTSTESEILV